jgi:hypothetical protein
MQFIHKKIDYTTPAGHQGGPGVSKQVTWYVGTPYINMTLAEFRVVQQAIGANLGSTWWLGGGAAASGGNAFMFVRNGSDADPGVALGLGELVMLRPPTNTVDDRGGAASTAITGAGTAASPTTTTAAVTTNIQNSAFTNPVGVNEDVDNWVYVTSAAATLPQLRRIKKNSSSTTSFYTVSLPDELRPSRPNDADVFDNIPLNTEPLSIIRPYDVVQCDGTSPAIGVALGTVAAGNYTIIQKCGLAPVLCDGSGTAIVVNVPAVPSTAGVAIGTAAKSLYQGGGLILPQQATSAAGVFIPCFVNFMAA